VLKALFPDSQCSTTVSFLPKKLEPYKKTTDMIPAGEFQLNPAFAIRFEGSHSEALSSLSILLSLYEQASARPLPLFRATNVAASLTGLHFNPEQSWDSYDGVNGDRSRTSSQMFYDLPLQGLRSLSPDESFPFAAELTAIFRPLTFTKLSGSKRPVSQRLASLNLGFADLQDKSTVAFSPFTSNSSEDGGA
jgi:hypothetical protein